jgi:hypothetical protein
MYTCSGGIDPALVEANPHPTGTWVVEGHEANELAPDPQLQTEGPW